MFYNLGSCSLIAISAILIAAPASAQTAPAGEGSASGAGVPEAGAQQGGISDIIVTATRREERLQNVPVAVSALSPQTLAGANVADVRNLTQVVPGFFGGRAAGVFLPVIRGVGSNSISVGDESNIATYVDGIYQGDPFSTWIDLFEVERVEVLRGPQGTIFGRNATGGLINVITPDPSYDARARFVAKAATMRNSSVDLNMGAYLTGKIAEGVAADFAAMYRESEDFVKDLNYGGKVGGYHVGSLRGKLMVEPSDSAKLVLISEYFERRGSENVYQPYMGNTAGKSFSGAIVPTGPWEQSTDLVPVLNIRRYNFALQTTFNFNGFDLQTTSSFANNRTEQATDSDSSNILLATFVAPAIKSKVYSQEIRLLSSSKGPFQWIAGAYAFYLDGSANFILSNRTNPALPLTVRNFNSDINTTSFAGFGEGTYEIVPDLFFTGGIRYTHEKREFDQVINGVHLFPQKAEKSFDRTTFRVSLRYNFAEKANVYATYSTGFKSGVFNMTGTSPTATEPETLDAIEGGIKADPFSWLRTNLAVYYYDYKNLQVTARDPSGPGYVLQNAATAEVYGGELEVTVAPHRDFNVRGSVAYTHGTYKSFPAAQVFIPLPTGGNLVTQADVSGNDMARAPRWSFNVAPSWTHDFGAGTLGVNASLYYSDRVYFDFMNSTSQPAYALLNGEISWTTADEKLRVSLWAANLTNKTVIQEIRPGALSTDLRYEMPRRIGLGAEFKF